ncbi:MULTISPECIES: ABC transporter substrate-binding protein [unclassified Sinorhizobium]|uniref:ABC transporter substrate-binding protein n=1 Tax=unclassified Sinorhizobium TaxID=2613772 RepID=UPI0035245D2B
MKNTATFLSKSKALLRAAAVAAVAAAFAGPAAAADPTPLTFWLNYPAAGFNAGFELAVKNGYYKDAGLDVKIEPGNGSQITAQLIAAGKADIGFADSAPVMKLVSDGAKIKVLATILQGNPNQVTALKKTGINSVAELKGHSVAIPNGGSQAAMFPLVLAANGLKDTDIKAVNMPKESMVAALMQGQVDAILGSIDFFSIQLKDLGAETTDFPFIDHGAPTVSTSIVASESFLKEHPDIAKAFVAASLKGWYAAVDDPNAAVAAMKAMFPDASEEQAPAQLEATKYLMCVNRAKFVGKATPEQWSDTVKILNQIGVLPGNVEAASYYTYDYLPPESELRSCPLK